MKKLILILSVSLCFIGFVSCTEIYIDSEVEESEIGVKNNDYIYIWTDEKTGVQYIIYREKTYNAGHGGITPRLNSDGSLYVVENSSEKTVEDLEKQGKE